MKNLELVGIMLKQGRRVYTSSLLPQVNPLILFSVLVSPSRDILYLEYSKKRVSISNEQLYYMENLGKGEIKISADIAKELGVTIGDKISIKGSLLEKIDNDYMSLYEKKSKQFIKYFKEQSDTDKKKILKELLEQDTTNEEVVKWLDKNYSGLIKEVGLE